MPPELASAHLGVPPVRLLELLAPLHRVDGLVVGDLPRLARVEAGILVAARVGRTAEADLVPRVRMPVERGARVAGPEIPKVNPREGRAGGFSQPGQPREGT